MFFTVDPASETPIYRQVSDAVTAAVTGGQLKPGDKLPTVRELASQLGIARGTIKRAYDELEGRGVIEMTQGRGTFVARREERPDSRKERAMAAIDTLLDDLEGMSFSTREMSIFFELKLRERVQRGYDLQITVVDCCPEALDQIADRLYDIDGVDIYKSELSDVLAYPYKVGDGMDLVVTTAAHYDALEQLVGKNKLARVSVRPSAKTIVQLARLPDGTRLGLMSAGAKFSGIMRRACDFVCPRAPLRGVRLFGAQESMGEFLADCDALLLPRGYEQLCAREESERLAAFSHDHPVIRYELEIDEGSFLAVSDRVSQLKTKKRKPGQA
ncbi:MAG: GntR family transcriptional regulator [Clostridia bacterium]|nr:GntR family transcriptional regulator [Clostridia bacterium]